MLLLSCEPLRLRKRPSSEKSAFRFIWTEPTKQARRHRFHEMSRVAEAVSFVTLHSSSGCDLDEFTYHNSRTASTNRQNISGKLWIQIFFVVPFILMVVPFLLVILVAFLVLSLLFFACNPRVNSIATPGPSLPRTSSSLKQTIHNMSFLGDLNHTLSDTGEAWNMQSFRERIWCRFVQ